MQSEASADHRITRHQGRKFGFAQVLGVGRQGEHMIVVENTATRHNMIVCTLCSCYPWPVLGLPPTWYKSAPYRSRAVKDPRGVLADFGVTLPDSTELRVWDSTAEVRYRVSPQRRVLARVPPPIRPR